MPETDINAQVAANLTNERLADDLNRLADDIRFLAPDERTARIREAARRLTAADNSDSVKSDFLAYNGATDETVDLRTCTNAELLEWLEWAQMQGDQVVADACRVLLAERDVAFPGRWDDESTSDPAPTWTVTGTWRQMGALGASEPFTAEALGHDSDEAAENARADADTAGYEHVHIESIEPTSEAKRVFGTDLPIRLVARSASHAEQVIDGFDDGPAELVQNGRVVRVFIEPSNAQHYDQIDVDADGVDPGITPPPLTIEQVISEATEMGLLDPPDLDAAIAQAKAEILDEIQAGTFSANCISTFADLHDHTDANTLGGLADDDFPLTGDAQIDFGNALQGALDEWIKAGGLTVTLSAANGRWLTAGELVAHLSRFPSDTPVTVATPDGGYLNLTGATNPYDTSESSIVIETNDDFDPRQF